MMLEEVLIAGPRITLTYQSKMRMWSEIKEKGCLQETTSRILKKVMVIWKKVMSEAITHGRRKMSEGCRISQVGGLSV
jgi:hypothetical protein